MKTILGLDCSSTTIGWAVLGVDDSGIKLIDHGNIKPPKKDECSIVERLDIVSKDIDALCSRVNPDNIIIEDIIQFMGKASTANTIITLAVFNRTIALQVYRTTGKIPEFLLPVSVRAKLRKFLTLDKLEKEDIPAELQKYFGKAFFTVSVKTKGKFKGQPVITTYDEADAVAAAWAGIIHLGLYKKVQ